MFVRQGAVTGGTAIAISNGIFVDDDGTGATSFTFTAAATGHTSDSAVLLSPPASKSAHANATRGQRPPR